MNETITFRIDAEHRVLVIRITDDARYDDTLRRYRELLESGAVHPSDRIVTDLRPLRTNPMTSESVRGVASLMQGFRARLEPDAPKPKTAIVAGNDVTFGLGRQYAQMAHDVRAEIEVFRDAPAACVWLDLDEDFLDRF